MTDPFESSRRKLARAKEHLRNLDEQIKMFKESVPEAVPIEADAQIEDEQPYDIKFVKPVPSSLAETVSDIVDNLRAALDQAGYAVAVASGKVAPRYSAFPFGGSAAAFENALKGRAKDIPEEIWPLFREFQPYRGGDDLLWALNEICVSNKHIVLVPVQISIPGFAVNATIPAQTTIPITFPKSSWNPTTNQVIVARQGPHVKLDYDIDFYISVALDEIELIRGKPVVGVLNKLTSVVESILLGIEAEARRLELIK